MHVLFSEKTTLAPNAKQTGSPAHGGLAIKEVYFLVHQRSELVVDLPFGLEEMRTRTPWLSQYVLRPQHNLTAANE